MADAAAIATRPLVAAKGNVLPVTAVCLVILALWYLACIPMNHVLTAPKIEAAGGGLANTLSYSWNTERPVLSRSARGSSKPRTPLSVPK